MCCCEQVNLKKDCVVQRIYKEEVHAKSSARKILMLGRSLELQVVHCNLLKDLEAGLVKRQDLAD